MVVPSTAPHANVFLLPLLPARERPRPLATVHRQCRRLHQHPRRPRSRVSPRYDKLTRLDPPHRTVASAAQAARRRRRRLAPRAGPGLGGEAQDPDGRHRPRLRHPRLQGLPPQSVTAQDAQGQEGEKWRPYRGCGSGWVGVAASDQVACPRHGAARLHCLCCLQRCRG